MKHLLILLVLFTGCKHKSNPMKAWEDEVQARSDSSIERIKKLKQGQTIHYDGCACTYSVSYVGGKFGALPIPPPPKCFRHRNDVIIP